MRWWAWLLVGVVAAWLVAVVALVAIGRRLAARELVAFVPNMVRLFRGLIGDPRVPPGSKIALGVAMVWLASPIDLIPEFIPIAGPLDDVVVGAIAIRLVLRSAGEAVVREHWRGDPRTLGVVLRVASVGAGRRGRG